MRSKACVEMADESGLGAGGGGAALFFLKPAHSYYVTEVASCEAVLVDACAKVEHRAIAWSLLTIDMRSILGDNQSIYMYIIYMYVHFVMYTNRSRI